MPKMMLAAMQNVLADMAGIIDRRAGTSGERSTGHGVRLAPCRSLKKFIWENGGEEYVVPLIKKYLRTPEQKAQLNAADATIEDCFKRTA